jgi:hypothetical protein
MFQTTNQITIGDWCNSLAKPPMEFTSSSWGLYAASCATPTTPSKRNISSRSNKPWQSYA